MQGDVGKGLRIMSAAKGWDCTRIREADGTYSESISNFDKQPNPIEAGDHCVGSLPGGTPMAWPNGYDTPAIGSVESTPFATPNRGTGTDASRRTTNADPNSGQGG